jgi:hypothetical protein
MMALLILAALIVLVNVLTYRRLPGRKAMAVSVLLPPMLFQVGNWLHLGYLDPFWPIAALVSLVASALGTIVLRLLLDSLVDRHRDGRMR